VQHCSPVSINEPLRFHFFIFSSFFFSKDRRFPRAQVCRGGWNDDMDQTLFKETLACREESSGNVLPQRNQ
jgi:hypothetical protein